MTDTPDPPRQHYTAPRMLGRPGFDAELVNRACRALYGYADLIGHWRDGRLTAEVERRRGPKRTSPAAATPGEVLAWERRMLRQWHRRGLLRADGTLRMPDPPMPRPLDAAALRVAFPHLTRRERAHLLRELRPTVDLTK